MPAAKSHFCSFCFSLYCLTFVMNKFIHCIRKLTDYLLQCKPVIKKINYEHI